MRRLFPFLVLFGAALIGLGWGLSSLGRIFSREREDALGALAQERGALQQYASAAVRQQLRGLMDDRRAAFEAAERDPLAPALGLYRAVGGAQLLPRLQGAAALRSVVGGVPRLLSRSRSLERLAARQNGQLEASPKSDEDPGPQSGAGLPAAQRLAMVVKLQHALDGNRRAEANQYVKEFLLHRALYLVPAWYDLYSTTELVHTLESHAALDPDLARGILRTGVQVASGYYVSGLQRLVLENAHRLGPEAGAALAEQIGTLSDQAGVPRDDFTERWAELSDSPLGLPAQVLAPVLAQGCWYLEPLPEGGVRGVFVDTQEVIGAVATEMRERGLLDPDGMTSLLDDGDLVAVSRLRVNVDMRRWERASADIMARHRLKTGLLVACGGLALVVISLVAFTQWRRHRFLELKSEFIATVSHELRTPVASIRLLGETLTRRMSGTPEAKDYPERIVREADSLSFLMENVLSFNRIGKGRWQIRPSHVSLEELFSNLRRLEPEKADDALRLEVDAHGLVLEADATLLQLLMSNLLRNARAYNKRRPVEVQVKVPRFPEPIITFTDNGIGLPKDEWDAIFQEFYRVPTAGLEVHGSGLGLALCKRIMKLHGGSIHVASSGPEGTTFELRFPRNRA